MSDLIEVVECQSEVITIQAGVIKDLFTLLCQYMSVEDINALPESKLAAKAAKMTEVL